MKYNAMYNKLLSTTIAMYSKAIYFNYRSQIILIFQNRIGKNENF